jgi:hypothetical protein
MQMGQRRIDRGKVLLDDRIATLAIGLLDGLLDLFDRLFARQHAADGEEAGLHDRVDPVAHSGSAGNRISVNHIELELLLEDRLLRLPRQVAQISSGPKGVFSRKTAPGGCGASTSIRSRKENWWQATKFALVMR